MRAKFRGAAHGPVLTSPCAKTNRIFEEGGRACGAWRGFGWSPICDSHSSSLTPSSFSVPSLRHESGEKKHWGAAYGKVGREKVGKKRKRTRQANTRGPQRVASSAALSHRKPPRRNSPPIIERTPAESQRRAPWETLPSVTRCSYITQMKSRRLPAETLLRPLLRVPASLRSGPARHASVSVSTCRGLPAIVRPPGGDMPAGAGKSRRPRTRMRHRHCEVEGENKWETLRLGTASSVGTNDRPDTARSF